MKKIFIVVMLLMMLCACGADTEPEQSVDIPTNDVESVTKPDNDLGEIIANVDVILKENMGDNIIATEYSEDTGRYMVLMTVDGIDNVYGTSDFYEFCYQVDSLSKTINENIGLPNVIIISSDTDVNVCLYATDCGENITHIFS